jgi:hypothetical protein
MIRSCKKVSNSKINILLNVDLAKSLLFRAVSMGLVVSAVACNDPASIPTNSSSSDNHSSSSARKTPHKEKGNGGTLERTGDPSVAETTQKSEPEQANLTALPGSILQAAPATPYIHYQYSLNGFDPRAVAPSRVNSRGRPTTDSAGVLVYSEAVNKQG